jgi:hypothetical protein
VGAELDVDEAPKEEDVMEDQDSALENQSSPTRGRYMRGGPVINAFDNRQHCSYKGKRYRAI